MKGASLPPGPKLPAALQTAWLAYRPYRFLEHCHRTFGDAFTLSTRIGRIVVFGSPAYAEEIFGLDETSLLGGAAQRPLVEFAGDRSLMKLDGLDHGEHRRILTRSLRPSQIHGGELLARITRAIARWPVGRRFDLGAELETLAIELAADLCLGGQSDEVGRTIALTIHRLRRSVRPLGMIREAFGPRRAGPYERLRALLEPQLVERIARGDHDTSCVLGRIARRRGTLGVDDLRDELMTLYVATVAGLACSMKYTFHWILHSRETGPRIRRTTAEHVARGDAQAIVREPYLDSVCKEVLQLCPDIPFAVRRATDDVTIGNWQVPAGTTLGVAIYLIQRRASSFPDPERFVPERFMNLQPARFEYLPFGGGQRGCVAASFFTFVQKMIVAVAFERRNISPIGRPHQPVSSLGLVSSLSGPLRARCELTSSTRWISHPVQSHAPAATGKAVGCPVSTGGP
jgi:cytochrome P450